MVQCCCPKVTAKDTLFFLFRRRSAANCCASPFTPCWEITGVFWRRGREGSNVAQWQTTNTTEFEYVTTGEVGGEANDGYISCWSTMGATNGSWSFFTNTANERCPTGYRVPTQAQ
jgi:hypothetical protein